jgi:uncharacterized protein YheU (UPF0270 family)
MIIPHTKLPPDTLESVIESFALREGTSYGEREYSLTEKVEKIKLQLDNKEVFVVYDSTFDSVSLITAQEAKGYMSI